MTAFNKDVAGDDGIAAAEVIVDDSDGTQGVEKELKECAVYLDKKYSNEKASGLARPFVYGAVREQVSADFGISDELIGEYGDGLLIVVPAYSGMKARDKVRLFWDDILVVTKRVVAGQVGGYITLNVAQEDVPAGLRSLRYEVDCKGSATKKSLSVTTLFRLGQPGMGADGIGNELAAPLIDLPASATIGATEAKAKVNVTIPAYLSMHAQDRITLFWGDELIEHVVTQGEVGKPVVLEVDESTIKRTGDSAALPIYYFVTDEVGNESEWSADTWVKVKLHAEGLKAPALLDRNGAVDTSGEIDLGNIGADHVVIQVPGPFQTGDSIMLSWTGYTESGQALPATYGPETINAAASVLTFKVPFAVLSALGGGSTRLSYTVNRKGVQSLSDAAFINIKGAPSALPAPGLNKADDDWIDAEHSLVHALIPADAGLQEEDEVTVQWIATASDGSVVALTGRMFRVTKYRVGKRNPVQFKGDKFLKPFDGGWVDVSYEVKRGKQTLRSEVVRFYIGEPAESLPAPTTERALANDTLDPLLAEYEFGMQIVVPANTAKPTPCTVTVIWETSEGGYFEDEQILEAGDEVSPFLIPAEKLKVKGDKPVKVWAYYLVEWEGKPSKMSADFLFNIATRAMLHKLCAGLNVPAVKDGKLDLGQIPVDGLTVEVPVYDGMAVGDRILVKFGNGTVKEHVVTQIGKQTVTVPSSALAALKDQKNLVMTYEIVRNPSGDKIVSQPVSVGLEGKVEQFPTSEKFEKHGERKLVLKQLLDYPAVQVRLDSGRASILHRNGFPPTARGLVCVYPNAQVSFLLKGRARQLSFDVADSRQVPSTVNFYCKDNKLIETIKTPPYTNPPAPGYTIHSTRVNYTTTGAAIAWFEFVDGGGDTLIDNLDYVAF